ncbi:thioredoxin [Brucella intermedia]|uniref:thioredoxin n=1 Tax=Brucella TaxID=234 RepID=UPI0009461B5F|nr:thioredoxin [Brucella intermedia]
MSVLNVDSSNFQANVMEADKHVVIDFWAEWCSPCKVIAPALDEIAADMKETVAIAKVNIDESPDLAAKLGVRSIPTLVMLKDGKILDTLVGAAPKSKLVTWINQYA